MSRLRNYECPHFSLGAKVRPLRAVLCCVVLCCARGERHVSPGAPTAPRDAATATWRQLLWLSLHRISSDPRAPGQRQAIYTEIDTPFDPQGAASTFFIAEVRDVIAQYDEPGVMSFHLALGLTEMYDMTNDVFGLFPGALR